jgi:hypothetical protein
MSAVLVENMPSKIVEKLWNKIDYFDLVDYINSDDYKKEKL